MLRKTWIQILILLSLPGAVFGVEFNRAAIHEQRLEGIDRSWRSAAVAQPGSAVSAMTSFSDFLVSASVSPARFTQREVSLLALADGGWVVGWDDDRFGSRSLFLQQFDAEMNRVGGNQLFAGSDYGSNYVDAWVGTDALSRIYVLYRDQTSGLIYCSRYDSDFSVDLNWFLVNDTSFSSFAGPYDAAVWPDGRMVVVWEAYGIDGSNIRVRVYNSDGSTVSAPSTVNTDGGASQHWVPSVAVQPGSGFLVAWEDYRNSRADIYARLFAGDGDPLGPEFSIVPPPHDNASQYAPVVAFSETARYVLAWVDQRLGQEIYAQRFGPNRGLIDGNVQISVGDTLAVNWGTDLTVAPDDNLMASWGISGADNSIISVQLDSSLVDLSGLQTMNMSSVGRRWSPSADFAGPDEFGIAWTEVRDEGADIHMQLFDAAGTKLLTSEELINDDSIGAPSIDPKVISTTNHYDLIVWTDQRSDPGDIYLDVLSNAGESLIGNVKVNQDTNPVLQSEPDVTAGGAGVLIAWIDSRPLGGLAGQRIYGRFASNLGDFSGNEFIISDTNQAAIKASPVAAMSYGGQSLVAWIDRRGASPQVWGRWLNAAGELDGPEFVISEAQYDLWNSDLQIGMDDLDRTYVIWLDAGGPEPVLKGKWFESDQSEGGSFSWESTVSDVGIEDIAADVGLDGTISVLWTGTEGNDVYLVQLDATGAEVTTPIMVNDDTESYAAEPAVNVCENDYVSTVWLDRREGNRRLFYQVFDNTLTALSGNQPVSTTVPTFMLDPDVHSHRGRAWFAWSDPRENGLNVYASNVLYLPTDVNDDDDLLPSGYSLAQNYPNPFNPTTT
ncbi:MAG: hypothetical protein JSU65_01640, partial [Candidatus Zixiibacteriota bacterium]